MDNTKQENDKPISFFSTCIGKQVDLCGITKYLKLRTLTYLNTKALKGKL